VSVQLVGLQITLTHVHYTTITRDTQLDHVEHADCFICCECKRHLRLQREIFLTCRYRYHCVGTVVLGTGQDRWNICGNRLEWQ